LPGLGRDNMARAQLNEWFLQSKHCITARRLFRASIHMCERERGERGEGRVCACVCVCLCVCVCVRENGCVSD